LVVVAASFLAMASIHAASDAELVLAENGTCDRQIVIPDKAESEIVEQWLLMTAKLMEATFEKNGFEVDVVKESAKQTDKPGIYLGATKFAAQNGVTVDPSDLWAYRIKAVGRDLVISGNDNQDPIKTIQRLKTPLAMLGTVKGACDFLREYAGVRFLFVNMSQSQYASSGDGLGILDKDGSLKIDTRSVAFTPVRKIAVPADIDLKKTPMMRANYDNAYETFYYIANNFFPPLSFVEGSEILWGVVILAKKYAQSHPEYFALLPDGKRSSELPIPARIRAISYCVTNTGVQNLMFEAAEQLIKNGEKTIAIGIQDGFGLCECNCADCNKLFGRKAENFEQVLARGKFEAGWGLHWDFRLFGQSYIKKLLPRQMQVVKARLGAQSYWSCNLSGVRNPRQFLSLAEPQIGSPG